MSLKDILSKLPNLSAEELGVVIATASAMQQAISAPPSRKPTGKSGGSTGKAPAAGKASGKTSTGRTSRGKAKKKGPPQAVSQFAGVPEFEAFKASDRVLRAALRRHGGLTLREAQELCQSDEELKQDHPALVKLAADNLRPEDAQAELGPALACFRQAQDDWFGYKNSRREPVVQAQPDAAAPQDESQL